MNKERIINISERVSFFIILLFSFFGLVISGNIIHEYSHKEDFKELVNRGYICLLEVPKEFTMKQFFEYELASYNYFYPEENKEKIDEVNKFSESKAYKREIPIILLFLISYFIVLTRRHKTK